MRRISRGVTLRDFLYVPTFALNSTDACAGLGIVMARDLTVESRPWPLLRGLAAARTQLQKAELAESLHRVSMRRHEKRLHIVGWGLDLVLPRDVGWDCVAEIYGQVSRCLETQKLVCQS